MRDERRGQWAWCCFSSLLPCSAHLPHFLHSFLHFFFFFWSSPPLWHPTSFSSSACSGGKKTKKTKNADSTVITQLELLVGATLAVLNSLLTRETDFEHSSSGAICVFIFIRLHVRHLDCRPQGAAGCRWGVTSFPTSLLSLDDLGGRGREVTASSSWPEGGQWWTQHDSGKKYLGKITGKHRSVQQKKKPRED